MNRFMETPVLIDNREANSSFNNVLNRIILPGFEEMSIAVGYFYISGIRMILSGLGERKLLENPDPKNLIRIIMSPQTDMATKEALSKGHADPDYLANKALTMFEQDLSDGSNNEEADTLIALLKNGVIQVRLYVEDFFHAKAYMAKVRQGETTNYYSIVGSSNFSEAGLTSNRELNLPRMGKLEYDALLNWFNSLWESETVDFNENLIKVIQVFQSSKLQREAKIPDILLSPFEMLTCLTHHYLGFMLREDFQEADQLAEFQRIGAENILIKLEKLGGAIVSDSVGLGKTFTAAEVVRRRHNEGKKVLIITPPSLRLQWKETLRQLNIPDNRQITYLSSGKLKQMKYEELEKLSGNNFDLIILDEAHNARNSKTHTFKNLRILHPKSRRAEVLLLTATPYNNSVTDIKNLISLATTENRLTNAGLAFKSFDEFLKITRSARKDGSTESLESNKTFVKSKLEIKNILSKIMLLRNRNMIKQKYKNIQIGGKPLKFFDPSVEKIEYRYDQRHHLIFNNVKSFLGGLILPHILLSKPDEISGKTLTFLYQLLLFKRLESSIYAFYNSLERIIQREEELLGELANEEWETIFEKCNQRILESEEGSLDVFSIQADSTDDGGENAAEKKINRIEKEDVKEWIEKDIRAVKNFIELYIEPLRQDKNEPMSLYDPKIDIFIGRISKDHFSKALVFTAYRDTVKYIGYKLKRAIKSKELSIRFELTMGNDERMPDKLDRFAPIGRNNQDLLPENELDMLVSTDVLAEGVNLQDADLLINFDLPWNPMRIVQRIGRINRIGSEKRMRVLNFVPEEELDSFLNLVAILHDKINQVTLLLGKEMAILSSEDEKRDIKPQEIGEEIKKVYNASHTSEFESLYQDRSLLSELDGESEEDYFRVNLYQAARSAGLREDDFALFKNFSANDKKNHFYTITHKDVNTLYRLYEVYGENEDHKDRLRQVWLKVTLDDQEELQPVDLLESGSLRAHQKISYGELSAIDTVSSLNEKSDSKFHTIFEDFKKKFSKSQVAQRRDVFSGVQKDVLVAIENAEKNTRGIGKDFRETAEELRDNGIQLFEKITRILKNNHLNQDEKRFFNRKLEDQALDLRRPLTEATYHPFLTVLFDFYDEMVPHNPQLRGTLYTFSEIKGYHSMSIFTKE